MRQDIVAKESVTTYEIHMTQRLRAQYDELANQPVRYTEVSADDPALKQPSQGDEGSAAVKKAANTKTSKQVQKERHIRAYEEKKNRINKLLCNNFDKLSGKESNMIVDHTCCQRLCR